MRSWATLIFFLATSAHAGDLPAPVARVLAGHSIPEDEVSVLVQAVDADAPLVSHQIERALNPASVMKLVTTFAALEELGPSYTWPTQIYFLGDFDGQTLKGDLGIKGFGDPFLVSEELWKLLRALRRVGLAEIEGDLVIDDSYFAPVRGDPGEFDNQPYRAYNVPPNALLLNYKAVRFEFFPAPDGHGVRIAMDPQLSNLDVRNELRLGSGPCRGYQVGIAFSIADPDRADRVVFSGEFPRSCQHYALTRTVLRHDTYAFGLFESLWAELGGRLRGRLRTESIDETLEPALTWRSHSLGEVIRSINKNSNNVMTRQLLYTLGAEKFGAPGTLEKGVDAVRATLASHGIDIAPLVIENGAGLSREARVSAGLLGAVLRAAYRSAYAPEFIASLSLGGLDGTTRARFGDGPEAGQMHVKTGTLDNVSALAGYLRGANGVIYVVVVLINAKDAHRGPGVELQDALIRWVYGLD